MTHSFTDKARTKLQGIIDDGRHQAEAALQELERSKPQDFILPAPEIMFGYDPDAEDQRGRGLTIGPRGGDLWGMHHNVLRQVSSKVKMPVRYVDHLAEQGDWGQELLAHNLNTLMMNRGGRSRHLVRVVNDQARGFLSDRYRRIDTPKVVDSFVNAIRQYGAVPVAAKCLSTQFYIKAAVPEVFEPIPGSPMVLGIHMRNSDFGNGAFELRVFFMRIVCTNMMVGSDGLRQVHLGRKIADNVRLSERTMDLDNRAIASATKDVVNSMLGGEAVKDKMEALKAAAENKVDIGRAIAQLRKSNDVTKVESEKILNVYNTGGIEQLPPGDTAWRFSNAISYFAKNEEVQPARALELEQLAGAVAGIGKKMNVPLVKEPGRAMTDEEQYEDDRS